MQEIIKKLDKLNTSIKDKTTEIKVIENPENAYYKRFGNDTERDKDIYLSRKDLRDMYGEKLNLLNDLEKRITVRKSCVLKMQKDLNILINLN